MIQFILNEMSGNRIIVSSTGVILMLVLKNIGSQITKRMERNFDCRWHGAGKSDRVMNCVR